MRNPKLAHILVHFSACWLPCVESASYIDSDKDKVCVRANVIILVSMLWPVALSFGAKSIDIMVTGMYYLSGGYLPGGNYVQIIFARLLFST